MKLLVCSVFDKAVEGFMPPVYFRARGEALRSFQSAVGSNKEFAQFPEHYSFFLLGTFDDSNGVFENLNAPELIARALEIKKDEVVPF